MPDPSFFSDTLRLYLELARTLVVPVIAWAAMELRGVRQKLMSIEMKMVTIEEGVKSHDVFDTQRFHAINSRLDRTEDRVESLTRQPRR